MSELTKEDLKVGHAYRAKRYREFLFANNDRTILWMNDNKIQYDSDTVRDGRNYPIVEIDKFLRWAKEEVKK